MSVTSSCINDSGILNDKMEDICGDKCRKYADDSWLYVGSISGIRKMTMCNCVMTLAVAEHIGTGGKSSYLNVGCECELKSVFNFHIYYR